MDQESEISTASCIVLFSNIRPSVPTGSGTTDQISLPAYEKSILLHSND